MPERKKGVVPRLRFPEFRDAEEWEVKRLGDRDVALFVRDTASRKDLCLETYVSTENMLPDFGGVTCATSLPPSGTIRKYQKRDVLIANIRPYLKKVWQADKAGAASNDVLVVRPSNTVDPRFLGLVLANDAFISFVMAGAKGVKMPRGDITLIKQFPIPIPVQRKEQQKIAECLSSLDEVIEFQAKKLEALKAHKKGLMQQLFPRKGETTPRLRFPEFRDAGEWGRYKLGELMTLEYGRSLPEDSRQNGLVPVVGSNGVVGFHNEALVSGPVIVVGRKGSVGEVNWIECDCYPIDTTFYVTKKYDECSLIFLKLLLEKGQLSSLSDNGAVPGLNRNDVYALKAALPSLPEQQKIADCLSSLDKVIELEAKKLEALKTHKKGLMQQLFPQEVD